MGHVLARAAGYGWAIVPHFPFRFERVTGSARAVRVERGGQRPPKAADLSPATFREAMILRGVRLASGARRHVEVLDYQLLGDATDHVIAVRLDAGGRVESVAMES